MGEGTMGGDPRWPKAPSSRSERAACRAEKMRARSARFFSFLIKCLQEDHPLNPNPESHWQSFFRDNEVLLQIDKDVRRLCPDISFFSQVPHIYYST